MDFSTKKSLLPCTDYEDMKKIVEMTGTTVDELFTVAVMLAEWTYSQPHLPIARENFHKYCSFMCRIFFTRKRSVERAKEFIDRYYTIKSLAPEYLLNRDPADQQLRASLKHFHFAAMPMHTSEMSRVYAAKILDKHYSPDMIANWHKFAMMVAEVQQWQDSTKEEIVVMDVANVTVQLVSVMTPAFIKKLLTCYLQAFVFKPKGLHFINVPVYADVVFNIMKSVVKPKIAERIFVYAKDDYKKLHDNVSTKYLPKDFGGDSYLLKDLHDAWLENLGRFRDWFLEQDNYVVQEELRPGKNISHSDIFGMEGSFRKLTVD